LRRWLILAGPKGRTIVCPRFWPWPPGPSLGCRREQGRYVVPSEYVLHNMLTRVAPAQLDRALQRWNEAYAGKDESLAIDGKTMCNALDERGQQTQVMSVVGHQTQICYTHKKRAPCL
jgi:hypothetical protein